jgi:hypothetical protein
MSSMCTFPQKIETLANEKLTRISKLCRDKKQYTKFPQFFFLQGTLYIPSMYAFSTASLLLTTWYHLRESLSELNSHRPTKTQQASGVFQISGLFLFFCFRFWNIFIDIIF